MSYEQGNTAAWRNTKIQPLDQDIDLKGNLCLSLTLPNQIQNANHVFRSRSGARQFCQS